MHCMRRPWVLTMGVPDRLRGHAETETWDSPVLQVPESRPWTDHPSISGELLKQRLQALGAGPDMEWVMKPAAWVRWPQLQRLLLRDEWADDALMRTIANICSAMLVNDPTKAIIPVGALEAYYEKPDEFPGYVADALQARGKSIDRIREFLAFANSNHMHWITLQLTIRAEAFEVRIWDSLPQRGDGAYREYAQLLSTLVPRGAVHHAFVYVPPKSQPRQNDGSSCGLYAALAMQAAVQPTRPLTEYFDRKDILVRACVLAMLVEAAEQGLLVRKGRPSNKNAELPDGTA